MSLLLALLTPLGAGAAALAMQHVERHLDRPVPHPDAPRPGMGRALRRHRLTLPARALVGLRPAEARSRA